MHRWRHPVVWDSGSPAASRSGDQASAVVEHLGALGVPVRLESVAGDDTAASTEPSVPNRRPPHQGKPIVVYRRPPDRIPPTTREAYAIGRLTFDTDRLPPEWVPLCNHLDEVWVPSQFHLDTFAASGVERAKLIEIPPGIDPAVYDPARTTAATVGNAGAFVFLSVLEWALSQGWDLLLSAYLAEFRPSDGVILLVCTSASPAGFSAADPARIVHEGVTEIARRLDLDPRLLPPIAAVTDALAPAQRPALFRAAHAFVQPSRGAGCQQPTLEAMAMGLPTIGTRWGANLEFMTDANSYLIRLDDVVPVRRDPDLRDTADRSVGHRWAQPSVPHLRSLMREVFEERSEAQHRGQAARANVVRHRSLAQTVAQVYERLHAIDAALSGPAPKQTGPPAVPSPELVGIWEGSFFVNHSLALVNRELVLALLHSGRVELQLLPYERNEFDETADPRYPLLSRRHRRSLDQPAQFHLRHQWPPQFDPAPPDGHWIVIQPWEYGVPPAAWVAKLNGSVDDLWVPSVHTRTRYIQAGMDSERVAVVPNGVNEQRFFPGLPPLPLPTRKRFRFLYVGGTLHRKGFDSLIEVYAKTFTAQDDVCLVIKVTGERTFYRGDNLQQALAPWRGQTNRPEIVLLEHDLSEPELSRLYAAAHCLVHPYRGEAFGLPIAEAMACGLPVIVPRYGPCLDFCSDDTSYLVPATEVPVPQEFVQGLVAEGLAPDTPPVWGEIDRAALAATMRAVWQHPDQAAAVGQRASRFTHEHLTWRQAAARAIGRLQVVLTRPVRRSL